MTIDKNEIKKILIIKLRGIGDVILSTVIFDNIQKEFPSAQIDYLTERPSKFALENLNLLTNIHLFNRKSTLSRLKLVKTIRSERYDLILDLFSNPSTAQITYFSGAKYRAGFPYKGRKYAYNIYGPSIRDVYHSADLHLEFLKEIGINTNSNNLHFGLAEEDKLFADNLLSEIKKNTKLVCLSPSGGWPSKKCDPEKFAEIGAEIRREYKYNLLILWGPGDESEAKDIKSLLGDSAVLAPPTTIGQMAAILSKCDAVVANDSGPMHISTSVGTPTLSMHGPTNPKLQGPYGDKHEWVRFEELDCIECNLLDCDKNHECFRNLSLDLVMDKFSNLLKKNKLVS